MSDFKFNPSKRENDTDITNGERAAVAEQMIRRNFDGRGNHESGDYETAAVDAIANIFHYCDRHGVDPETVIKTAMMHWLAER